MSKYSFSIEQAELWAKKRFERSRDALYWEFSELCEPEPVCDEDITYIKEQAQNQTIWAVENKFGKAFKHTQLMRLFNYVKGLA